MVAASAARGLSAPDLAGIRATLASGRKPKVVFTEAAGQIAGQTGQVVELLDPADDEWIVVRFGRDELPFSPTDLAIPPKAAPKAQSVRKPEPKPAPPAAPPPPPPHEVPYEQPVVSLPPQRQEPTVTTETIPTDDAPKPAKKAAAPRQPRVKPLPTLTVTIAYLDGEWTVGAQQGSRALARPYVIKAAEALKMVALLDVPGVHEAVEQIVDAEREQTQAHAARLRAELAEIEAKLADLPSTSH
jgi:outer membrane biosynthesis protein TonB